MSSSETVSSGISKAIGIAGNQVALSKLIWEQCGVFIWQARISDWERAGGIPRREKALLVAKVTGVPLEQLLIPRKRRHRRVARKKVPA